MSTDNKARAEEESTVQINPIKMRIVIETWSLLSLCEFSTSKLNQMSRINSAIGFRAKNN